MFFRNNNLGFGSKAYFLGLSFVFCSLFGLVVNSPDSYAIHTASMVTSGPTSVDAKPNGDGSASVNISAEDINIVTNCRAGYNLTISGPSDRNLYRNGDDTNNAPGQFFTPVDGVSALADTSNSWGYSLTANDASGVFTPLSDTPAFLKTVAQTASETDINDSFSVYYGVSVSSTINPGSYYMSNNNTIVYQLTLDPSCVDYDIIFNPNGGTGDMDSQAVVVNEPTRIKANSFTAPAIGTSYQNADGTTISAVADKLWTFWGWNTKADGTGDWYKNREQVTNLVNQGETITLYAQWKQATLDDMLTPTSGTRTITHETMQDMSGAICWNSDKFTAIGTPYGQATLTDDRDGTVRSYTIARLPDGYCWMTQNLNLGASTDITLTSDDTDLEEGTTFILPASDPNNFSTSNTQANHNKPTVLNDMIIPDYTVNGTTYSGNITGYYSFAAATADINTYSKTSISEISTSICPKGWDLPTSLQYSELITKGRIAAYNNTSYVGRNAGNEPYYFVYGGYRKAAGNVINSTYFSSPDSYGYLWMANNFNGTYGFDTYAFSSGLLSTSNTAGGVYGRTIAKYSGLSIRCMADMNEADYRITFVNTSTGETQTQIVGLFGDNNTATIKLPARWSRSGYGLSGWDTNSSGTNIVYTNGQTITLESDITLYTVWRQAYNISYNGHGADAGSMTNVIHINTYENDIFDLFASNYSRTNYGFAGWSFDPNARPGGTSKIYGPNEAITAPAGTSGETKILYAVWVQSAGDIQDWQGCSSMNIGDVTALKDTRDNNVYTVGKLADENCWMMENLRLSVLGSNDSSKSQGFGGVFAGLAESETSFPSTATANSLYYSGTQSGTATIDIGTNNTPGSRLPRHNNSNTSSRITNPSVTDNRFNVYTAHNTSFSGQVYSYGNYYSWAAAKASTEDPYTATSQPTSICPSGWKLPYGGTASSAGNTSGGFYYLGSKLGATASSEASSRIWRSYPNNYVYSGYHFGTLSNGYNSYYYSTSISRPTPYMASVEDDSLSAGGILSAGTAARSVRCVAE